MDETIGFCGIDCGGCRVFLASRNDDDEIRKLLSEFWAFYYDEEVPPEDFYCEGCLSSAARLFKCCEVCRIRKCAIEKRVMNCARCDEYSCRALTNFLADDLDCRQRLERIRREVFHPADVVAEHR